MNAHVDIDSQLPAKLRSLPEIVAEYEEKVENIPVLLKEYENFHRQIDVQTCISGEYVGRVYNYHPSLYSNTLKNNLLKSAWQHVYKGLNINRIASARDRGRFQTALETPPDFTIDNIRATFGDYLQNSRFHILKGLAECFCDLDQAYKSHSKVKVGVSGLPKRIILPNICCSYGILNWGGERLKDTINAMRVFEDREHVEYKEFQNFIEEVVKKGEAEFDGMRLKRFNNGNGHLFFSKEKMDLVNRGLSEFYGEVLPDVESDGSVAPKETGTAVSKDLQFYGTPKAVIDRIIKGTCFKSGAKYLEPQCGEGAIMDAIRANDETAEILGMEYHAGRAEICQEKGYKVIRRNFLTAEPLPVFDYIIMNPPFYGTHWKKHLVHARKFLKPRESQWGMGSLLICILPATAFYDGHLDEMGLIKGGFERAWTDLPVGSFAESGTNVPTGYITLGPEE